jgi:bacterioferritin
MKAKDGVLEHLYTILGTEITALSQYFLHAELCAGWGYERLHKKFRETSMEEMKDAENLIKHIIYLEGRPSLNVETIKSANTVQELLQIDLDLERTGVNRLVAAIEHCQNVGDFTTRNIFEEMIRDEETHVDWLETQLELIGQIGIDNYLTQQVHD